MTDGSNRATIFKSIKLYACIQRRKNCFWMRKTRTTVWRSLFLANWKGRTELKFWIFFNWRRRTTLKTEYRPCLKVTSQKAKTSKERYYIKRSVRPTQVPRESISLKLRASLTKKPHINSVKFQCLCHQNPRLVQIESKVKSWWRVIWKWKAPRSRATSIMRP